jgi:hypothetical protein
MSPRIDLGHFVEILALCPLHGSSSLLDVAAPGSENVNASICSVKFRWTMRQFSHRCQRVALASSSPIAGQFLTGPVTQNFRPASMESNPAVATGALGGVHSCGARWRRVGTTPVREP